MPANSGAITGTVAHQHSAPSGDGGFLNEGVTGWQGGTVGEVILNDGTDVPVWSDNTANPLIKVSKTFADISVPSMTMDVYTLAQDAALVNVFTNITTPFDVSTGVTVGDALDDNGFVDAADFTAGTGLTNATRGAYTLNMKTMRSTTGTTGIKCYNFSTSGGGGSTFSQLTSGNNENLYAPTGSSRTEVIQTYQTGQVLIGEDVCKATWFLRRVGTTTGDIKAYVRTSTGSLIATSTTVLDASTLTTSYVEHEFEFPDVEILDNYGLSLSSEDLTAGQVDMESMNADISNGICYQKIGTTWSQIITAAIKMNVTYNCTPVTTDTVGAVDFYLQVVD